MRAMLLIAANFMREQRWIVVGLAAWVVAAAALLGFASDYPSRDDVLFYLRQQAAYGLVFAVLITSSSLQNERRSRRILAVLSKGVWRSQYLGGMLLGVAGATLVYCAVFAIGAAWLSARAGLPAARIPSLVLMVLAVAIFSAAVTLFFATFLHPLFASGAASLVLGIPFLAGRYLGIDLGTWIAGYQVARSVATFTLDSPWQAPWFPVVLAVGQAFAWWLAASWIFSYRDVTAAVE